MNQAILYQVPAHWLAAVMLLLILLANFLGYRYRKARIRKDPEIQSEGLGQMESSLLGLTALFLAFTFGMASSKFEARRGIIIIEANEIQTAILRCDLYPDSLRRLFHEDFRNYLDARLAYYDAGIDPQKIQSSLKSADEYSLKIWERAVGYSQDPSHLIPSMHMIPAVNDMIDIVTTRDAQRIAKVPPLILAVLAVLLLISSFLTGYGQKGKRDFILISGFALMMTMAMYLIIEQDRPRSGLLNLDTAQERIREVRDRLR